ncbi:hypothetical protein HDU85_001452 [Gaertneriomyces sp. JEL0708]|nr:hypothetical protein HDU85_001452 [Gaertneriomyces sp. JEL0708]
MCNLKGSGNGMFSFGASSAPLAPPISDSDLKEIVHDRILRQAGVDYEARPILCFYACQLPNPRGADYDVLLRFMMEKIDEFVESDYVLVMFSAGAEYTPSWKWMYKAYAGLSRKYRKNLKHLYVVHPNFWSKLLIQTMAMIVSPKFARKIAWVYNLTALARVVPLKQVYIPEILYKIDESYQPRSTSRQATTGAGASGSSTTPTTTTGRVFGAPIVRLMGATGEKGIPLVVRDTTQYIFSHGLDTEGLFRRSPSSVELQETKMAYENDTSVDFSTKAGGGSGGVHLACGVLKTFFRDMPEPVFGEGMYEVLKGITGLYSCEREKLKRGELSFSV